FIPAFFFGIVHGVGFRLGVLWGGWFMVWALRGLSSLWSDGYIDCSVPVVKRLLFLFLTLHKFGSPKRPRWGVGACPATPRGNPIRPVYLWCRNGPQRRWAKASGGSGSLKIHLLW